MFMFRARKSPFPTYVSVDFLIILHFPKIHVINHQRLPHGEFTLGQYAHHPLILCEPGQIYRTVYDSKQVIVHTFIEITGDKVQGWGPWSSLNLPFLRGPRRVAPFGETL